MIKSINGMEFSEQIVNRILYFIAGTLTILSSLLLWKMYGELLFIDTMILSILC